MSVSKNGLFCWYASNDEKKLYNDFGSFNPFEPAPAVLKCLFGMCLHVHMLAHEECTSSHVLVGNFLFLYQHNGR